MFWILLEIHHSWEYRSIFTHFNKLELHPQRPHSRIVDALQICVFRCPMGPKKYIIGGLRMLYSHHLKSARIWI